jgi:hypothetical protein
VALESTQPLTEMSTRKLPRGQVRPASKADNVNGICEPTVQKNVGASTFSQPLVHLRPVTGIALAFTTKT